MSMDRISRQVGGAPTEAILFMSSMIELFAPMDWKGTARWGSLSMDRIFVLHLSGTYVSHTTDQDNSTDMSVCLFEPGRVAASSMIDHYCNLDYLSILLLRPYLTFASVDSYPIVAG